MHHSVMREYYILLALKHGGISVISAMYVTFLLSKGLDLFEVNLVNTVFFVTLFLCEIPTGAIADVFGRKTSYVLSCGFYALSFFVYAQVDTFFGFAGAEVLAAIGATCASGAFDAWFVDRLRHHGYNASLTPMFSRGAFIARLAGLCMALIGAFIADAYPTIPWLIGGSLFFVMGVYVALFMKEEYFEHAQFSWKMGWEECLRTIKGSLRYGRENANVRFIILAMIALNFAVMAPNMQWQPRFGEWLPSYREFGLIYAGIALMLMAGAWLAPRLLLRWRNERYLVLAMLALTGVGLLIAGIVPQIGVALSAFLVHEIARGAIAPLKDAYLHDQIPSKERATIVSFESIGHHFGGALGLIVSGAVAQTWSIPYAWALSGGCLIAAAMLLYRRA